MWSLCICAWCEGELVEPPLLEPAELMEHMELFLLPRLEGEEGGVWERTLWRYWRCWSEEDDSKQYDLNRHFHRYCHCNTDTDISDCESLLSEQDTTELEDFESTFDRDMLTHFTEIDDQLDIVTASEYLDLLLHWLTATNIQLLKAAEDEEQGDYYENHKAGGYEVEAFQV